jgi:hypothetical protein
MPVATPESVGIREIERLGYLIPTRMRSYVDLSIGKVAGDKLITTQRIDNRRCQILVEILTWQSLDVDCRNLLFWHEIARIQNSSITSNRSEYRTIAVSLLLGIVDIATQNVGILAASLLVAGLSGFRLYQKQMGEWSLQKLTAADQGAIGLAQDFGYDPLLAKKLLTTAILTLQKQSSSRFLQDRYLARLQVLDLLAGIPERENN